MQGRRVIAVMAAAGLGAGLMASAAMAATTYTFTSIAAPEGSGSYGHTYLLSNGNYVVTDPNFDAGTVPDVGAVHLYSGVTNTLISTLTGSTESDNVGQDIAVLPSGNFVVLSPNWHGGFYSAGAVTFVNGVTGLAGTVSSGNSLVGAHDEDFVGANVHVLDNGNYVTWSIVVDGASASNVGAVTFGTGTSGQPVGPISPTNSLMGSHGEDHVGMNGLVELSDSDYVMVSTIWDDDSKPDAGAVTWASGTTGIVGTVSGANSIIGNHSYDTVGNGSVVALTNGNYVVGSPWWKNDTVVEAGAATWASGDGTTVGPVTTANSLYGTAASDWVGTTGIVALSNGNYVVSSTYWDNSSVVDAGASTWGNGTTGTTGAISTSNSIYGTTTGDHVGWVTALVGNGNYVVTTPDWDNGGVTDVGMSMWVDGASATSAVGGSAHTLTGTRTNDRIGYSVVALDDGDYVSLSGGWHANDAEDPSAAIVWQPGTGPDSGTVSASNAWHWAPAAYDSITVEPLASGRFAIIDGAADINGVENAGSVTIVDGTASTGGLIDASNSLVGTTIGDKVGTKYQVLSTGNLVVGSPFWDDGATVDVGAVTLLTGVSPAVGAVTSSNSLIGTVWGGRIGAEFGKPDDEGLRSFAVAVSSTGAVDGDAAEYSGVITWINGTTPTVGTVSRTNSLYGTSEEDLIGQNGNNQTRVTTYADGTYVVISPMWDNGDVQDAGAVTLGLADGSTVGPVSAANSFIGLESGSGNGLLATYRPYPISQELVVGAANVANSTGTVYIGQLNDRRLTLMDPVRDLPTSGADVGRLLMIAMALLGAGTVTLAATRRRFT